jgi:hypothetical protein
MLRGRTSVKAVTLTASSLPTISKRFVPSLLMSFSNEQVRLPLLLPLHLSPLMLHLPLLSLYVHLLLLLSLTPMRSSLLPLPLLQLLARLLLLLLRRRSPVITRKRRRQMQSAVVLNDCAECSWC